MNQEDVRKIFWYETDTGRLRSLKGGKPYPWHKIGKNGRYLATSLGGKSYYAHRLVWLYHHGTTPHMLDHIDGNSANNRIENLRECTNAQNQYNSLKKINNKSGFKGVIYQESPFNPWTARIVFRGKQIYLGRYPTPERASEAYALAAEKYAGPFARLGDK
jgi:hypothetical protein